MRQTFEIRSYDLKPSTRPELERLMSEGALPSAVIKMGETSVNGLQR